MAIVRRVVAVLAVVVVGLVFGTGTGAATAGKFFQPPTPYNETYQFDPECPGQKLNVKGRAVGVSWLLNVPGSNGQAFLANDRYDFRETWTDLKNGKKFQISGHGFFTETSATFVANEDVPEDLVPPEGLVGPVYLFKALDIGQPFIVTNSAGKVILRDKGILGQEYLFDTLGDSAPGGTELSFEITKVIGPHPGLDVDVCELADQLT